MKAADAVIATLQSWRSDEHFHKLFEEAVVLSATLDAERPAVPRQKSVPRRLDDGSQGHNFSAPEDYYRSIYFRVIDETVGAIRNRFQGKGFEILLVAERVILTSLSGKSVEQSDLQQLCEHFGDDINIIRLQPQLEVLSNIEKIMLAYCDCSRLASGSGNSCITRIR